MYIERIALLYRTLGCNNSDIARKLNISPSNISRIRTGKRLYCALDRPICSFAQGVYLFARDKDMLDFLCNLCGAQSTDRDVVVTALKKWLFAADIQPVDESEAAARSNRRSDTQQNRSYGEKLNEVMNMLEMSNIRLARLINVDSSLISRFRNGMRSPKESSAISALLVKTLLHRAIEQNCVDLLSKLTDIPCETLSSDEKGWTVLLRWLHEENTETVFYKVDRLLDCIDEYSDTKTIKLPSAEKLIAEYSTGDIKTEYIGTDEFKQAAIHLLARVAQSGKELYIYSDAAMNWMLSDPVFLLNGSSLLLACVKRGVKVHIINNTDREADEMIVAIKSWMPLYMTGMIDAHVCRRQRDTRFSHTLVIDKGRQAVFGTHVRGTEKNGRYYYTDDTDRVADFLEQYEKLISMSSPLLKVYVENGENVNPVYNGGDMSWMFLSPSAATMPEELLESMLKRNEISGENAQQIRRVWKTSRDVFLNAIKTENIREFLVLPSDEELFAGRVKLNPVPLFASQDVYYNSEEFSAHIQAIKALLAEHENYHVYVLPELPFTGIQIGISNEMVVIMRSLSPRAVFSLTDQSIMATFAQSFNMLGERYKDEREEGFRNLNKYL